MRYTPFEFARRGGRAVLGFASGKTRIQSAQRLLYFLIQSLPDKEDYLLFAPRLPDEAMTGNLYADKRALLHALPKGGIVAEVGCWKGGFSKDIMRVCKPDELHLIDIDLSPLVPVSGAKTHEGDSVEILSKFPNEHFDWLYIDADHSYEGVKRDLAEAHRVLKRSGHMVCNDYATWCPNAAAPYGVARAVNELIISKGYKVRALAFHPQGLNDIMIQKP